MSNKPKIAFYWCASCGGCEESIVDLAEDILTVVENIDIVFWPVAMDFKRKDIEIMEDNSILITFLNGAIRTSEQYEMSQILRKKSKYMVAYGSCAHLGGVPSLINQFTKNMLLEYVYKQAPTVINDSGTYPNTHINHNGYELELPQLHHLVRSLDQVVEVDYYLPGCPPTPSLLKQAIELFLKGELPQKGTVLAPDIALCNECLRKDTKPTDLTFKEFKRPHLVNIDPNTCFLAQGIICMGPATRSGCGNLCINGNMPCTGCFGPLSRVKDQGAKILSFLTSSIEGKEEKEICSVLDTIPDPIGTFYRYGLSKCLIKGNVKGI